jgi:VanZ family protein
VKRTREQKFFTFILVFYWVGLFAATHIQIPNWTRNMGVSDKTMHFAAFTILTLLLWLSTSFGEKADWTKIRPWLITGIILIYGIFDELSQYFVKGRSVDPYDLASNFSGAAIIMVLVTFLASSRATMILFIICPIFLPALVRSHLIPPNSILENSAYLACFAIVTIAWIIYFSSVHNLNLRRPKHIPIFFAGPAGTVAIVKIYTALTDKPMPEHAILISFAAIILTLLIWHSITYKRAAI